MNVFLTPELKPFVGGTYFPLRDSLGRPGFATLVKSIAKEVRSTTYVDNVNELGYMHATDQVPYAVMPWCVIFNEWRIT